MINKIKMLYDIYFSRINVDRQLQRYQRKARKTDDFSRINVDRQLQLMGSGTYWRNNFSRINVDRQLQL